MAARLSAHYNLVIFAEPAGRSGAAFMTSSCYETLILLSPAAKRL
jgi:hypothetical protein